MLDITKSTVLYNFYQAVLYGKPKKFFEEVTDACYHKIAYSNWMKTPPRLLTIYMCQLQRSSSFSYGRVLLVH